MTREEKHFLYFRMKSCVRICWKQKKLSVATRDKRKSKQKLRWLTLPSIFTNISHKLFPAWRACAFIFSHILQFAHNILSHPSHISFKLKTTFASFNIYYHVVKEIWMAITKWCTIQIFYIFGFIRFHPKLQIKFNKRVFYNLKIDKNLRFENNSIVRVSYKIYCLFAFYTAHGTNHKNTIIKWKKTFKFGLTSSD